LRDDLRLRNFPIELMDALDSELNRLNELNDSKLTRKDLVIEILEKHFSKKARTRFGEDELMNIVIDINGKINSLLDGQLLVLEMMDKD